MAITKIWSIKSRLDVSLNYIENPDKTELIPDIDAVEGAIKYIANTDKTDKCLYVKAFNCSVESAYKTMETLSPEQTKEIRKLYNKIVKKLHPDMNPNVTEQEKELFVRAKDAYKNGDLETIRAIALMIDEVSEYKEPTDSMKELREKINKLNTLIANIEYEIRYIKEQFPYNQKEFLANPTKVDARKKELEDILEEYKEIYAFYEEKLKKLMEDLNNG